MGKVTIAAHTVFLPREHIYFLEEWLLYHMYMGVNRFYLYDNTGSVLSPKYSGNATKGIDKVRSNYGEATSHLADEDVYNILMEIVSKYSDSVTHVTWQPIHPRKKVIYYAQREAIRDCLIRYGSDVDWIYFLDLDELYYSPTAVTIRDAIEYCEQYGFSQVVLRQHTFASRYTNLSTKTKFATISELC